MDRVDGILLLDKPAGRTSNGALQTVKRLLGARKAGHAGTLDPMATGLLPICLGEATKFSSVLLDGDKSYRAEVRLGIRTSTGDAEGEILAEQSVAVTLEDIDRALRSFMGTHSQVAPAHSALKFRGRPLYEYARAGQEVPRKTRDVHIRKLSLDDLDGEVIRISVSCSKGTYIRSLAEDIGARLGCGAHLSGLRRTGSGPFSLDGAIMLETLESLSLAERRSLLLPPETALLRLPEARVSVESAARLRKGQGVVAPEGCPVGLVRIHEMPGTFVGLGEVTGVGVLIPRRLLSQQVELEPSVPTSV